MISFTDSAEHKFNIQKAGAKVRNIAWDLTFKEWNTWWLQQGIDKNNPNSSFDGDQPCMCRIGDSGAYSLDNIYCATRRQNAIDNRKNKKYVTRSGHFKKIKTPEGLFKSRQEAADHFGVAAVTISSWVKRYPNNYSYQV